MFVADYPDFYKQNRYEMELLNIHTDLHEDKSEILPASLLTLNGPNSEYKLLKCGHYSS